MLPWGFPTRSENQVIQVIYHHGGRKSFETVFSPLRGSAHSTVTALPSTLALESKGMAISLEKMTMPGFPNSAFRHKSLQLRMKPYDVRLRHYTKYL